MTKTYIMQHNLPMHIRVSSTLHLKWIVFISWLGFEMDSVHLTVYIIPHQLNDVLILTSHTLLDVPTLNLDYEMEKILVWEGVWQTYNTIRC